MKILIVGASGFLGKKLFNILSKEFEVIGTTHTKKKGFIDLDITKKDKTLQLIEKVKPNMIIMPASITDVDFCEKEKEKAHQTNVEGVKSIVEGCKKINARLIYFSTDYVFNGKKGNYKEDDQLNPLSYYAKTKVEAEEIVKNSRLDYIIGRVSCLYGYNSTEDKQTFVNFVISNIKKGNPVSAFRDQILSPTLIDDIVNAILILIKKWENGIFHIAGSEPISRYDFTLKITDVFNLDKKLIKSIKTSELKQKAKRPLNASLDISKLEKLGIKMSNIEEGLKKMKEQLE